MTIHSLSCDNVTVSYGTQTVLEHVSCFIDSGEALCVLGENGAGKSTLIKCLLGLQKPDRGTISTNGFTLTEVGYLPQHTNVRHDFPASVWEVVLSGCLNMRGAKPFYSKKEKSVAVNSLSIVGANHLKNKSFSTLSGGQQQRVLLARALCSAKKLLILDEPAAGLDPAATAELFSLISQLKQQGLAIVVVSHNTQNALSVSERVLYLAGQGTQYFFGTKDAFVESEYSKSFGEVATHV